MLFIIEKKSNYFALFCAVLTVVIKIISLYYTTETFDIYNQEVTPKTTTLFFISIISFIIGYVVVFLLHSKGGEGKLLYLNKPNMTLVIILQVSLLFFVSISILGFGGVPLLMNVLQGVPLSEIRQRSIIPGSLGIINMLSFIVFYMSIIGLRYRQNYLNKTIFYIGIILCILGLSFAGSRQGFVLLCVIYISTNYITGGIRILSIKMIVLFSSVVFIFVYLGASRLGESLSFNNYLFPILFYFGLPTMNANYLTQIPPSDVNPLYFFLEYLPNFMGQISENNLPMTYEPTSPVGLIGSSFFYGGKVLVFLSSLFHGGLLALTAVKANSSRLAAISMPFIAWSCVASFSHSGVFVYINSIIPIIGVFIFSRITNTTFKYFAQSK